MASENDLFSSSLKPARLDIIPNCLASPCILTLDRWEWGMMFYIRVDLAGSYHAYPHVGGPFKTLEEVYSAIECDLKQRQDPKIMMPQPEDTQVDYVVRQCLYWPDGKRKKRFNVDERRDRRRMLVQALVDKYNDYIGDLAYELKDVVHYESVCVSDAYKVTYHINFTTKIKGTEDLDCRHDELFFAEVACDIKTGERKFVVSCFCRIHPIDNGRCYGCNAKHPNAAVYTPGQADACFPFGASNMVREDCDEDPVAEEKRLRILYEKMGFNKL
ncbi:uncharacterized protein LOC124651712 [Lolium rigidum]|uniref:uncharacterized protein LOC124651712 n=1 Tax=Lolium rigidum TaxID=89674 RepID=UPI001F5C320F|nr:uncharacterized protein LOC124651712 [Lolium rigidum]